MDAGSLLEAEAVGDGWALASKENRHPLVVPPLLAARVTSAWKMPVLFVFK